MISISWRVFVFQQKNDPDLTVYFVKETNKAMEIWRKYLLGESRNKGKYKHHIFFFDFLDLDNCKGI